MRSNKKRLRFDGRVFGDKGLVLNLKCELRGDPKADLGTYSLKHNADREGAGDF